jgi:hypothetical protein
MFLRFRIPKRFDGRDEDGLTFEESVKKDVIFHIEQYYIVDYSGHNSFNALYTLKCYYNEYLDKLMPSKIASELKKTIENKIGKKNLK